MMKRIFVFLFLCSHSGIFGQESEQDIFDTEFNDEKTEQASAPMFRTPPFAPIITAITPLGSDHTAIIDGQSDPDTGIIVVDMATNEIMMGTYADSLGDWSGPVGGPDGNYNVIAYAFNINEEYSAPSFAGFFTISA
ncbi:MAG TPA: hypothetical protein VHO47_00640 [Candidatus Babeliales bacterium]|nr:hypothetical protein [Candidatus Babeliales bacterium]